ncbi:MAG: DNA-protecting protein DprA [Acidobacteria bacterium]|nr:DNA-protecting protein DprA [Acidobacteriota bacterium]
MSLLCLYADAPAFPARLSAIPSPPEQLWILGDPARLPDWSTPSIAIVGARAASRDGLDNAARVARELARAGVVVISGLARGIDAAAHQATLDAGGRTIAVLGSGLARIYPNEHHDLASRVAATGAVLSEYPPDTAPLPPLFPKRNRLVSGLADVVLVVEAAEKSGALITASAALDQGKDVLVMPGRVAGGRNSGGHRLIRDGARLVETADDILADMAWFDTSASPSRAEPSPEPVEFTVDDVVAETGESPAAVLARLLQLELAGEVQRIGSARFLRLQRRVLT